MTKKEVLTIKEDLKKKIETAKEFKEKAKGDFEVGYEAGMIRGLERALELIEDLEAIKASKKEA